MFLRLMFTTVLGSFVFSSLACKSSSADQQSKVNMLADEPGFSASNEGTISSAKSMAAAPVNLTNHPNKSGGTVIAGGGAIVETKESGVQPAGNYSLPVTQELPNYYEQEIKDYFEWAPGVKEELLNIARLIENRLPFVGNFGFDSENGLSAVDLSLIKSRFFLTKKFSKTSLPHLKVDLPKRQIFNTFELIKNVNDQFQKQKIIEVVEEAKSLPPRVHALLLVHELLHHHPSLGFDDIYHNFIDRFIYGLQIALDIQDRHKSIATTDLLQQNLSTKEISDLSQLQEDLFYLSTDRFPSYSKRNSRFKGLASYVLVDFVWEINPMGGGLMISPKSVRAILPYASYFPKALWKVSEQFAEIRNKPINNFNQFIEIEIGKNDDLLVSKNYVSVNSFLILTGSANEFASNVVLDSSLWINVGRSCANNLFNNLFKTGNTTTGIARTLVKQFSPSYLIMNCSAQNSFFQTIWSTSSEPELDVSGDDHHLMDIMFDVPLTIINSEGPVNMNGVLVLGVLFQSKIFEDFFASEDVSNASLANVRISNSVLFNCGRDKCSQSMANVYVNYRGTWFLRGTVPENFKISDWKFIHTRHSTNGFEQYTPVNGLPRTSFGKRDGSKIPYLGDMPLNVEYINTP